MTRYILDSDIASYLTDTSQPTHQQVRRRLSSLHDNDTVYFSIITLYEFRYSLSNARENLELFPKLQIALRLLERFPILPLSEGAANLFGDLKADFKKETGISANALRRHNVDFILASAAIEFDAVLVK
jgi:predicted nucleic acid-binding protein